MLSNARKLWAWGRELFPVDGFFFDRPLVLFQSDDWGRVGVRDSDGLECLRSAEIVPEHPYDFYSLEDADDLAVLCAALKRHHDSTGVSPRIGMNFLLFNLDFGKMRSDDFKTVHLLPLADGLPEGWSRPGLFEAYRAGIDDGVFQPSLHGTTHFCRPAVEKALAENEARAGLLKTLWQAGTSYIHWRMPWIGYEYWAPESPEEDSFLPAQTQRELIGCAVGAFARMFSTLPRSACAPGYRANEDTHRGWAQHGIRVAQNGPGQDLPPHFDRFGVLQLSRTVDFEPATDPSFSVEKCLLQAEACFARGLPAVVSVHSINFHSRLRDFRTPTLEALDTFLLALETKHPDILYLRDDDLFDLVNRGSCATHGGLVQVTVTRKPFRKTGRRRLSA